MTTHHKYQEQHLRNAKYFPPNWSQHHLPCVSHVVDVRIPELELSDDKASVGSDDTKTGDQ